MWLRDSNYKATDIRAWSDTCRDLAQDLSPQPPVPVRWDDPVLIQETISKMKPYKAPGVDGWRAQELKLIPRLPYGIWQTCSMQFGKVSLVPTKCSPCTLGKDLLTVYILRWTPYYHPGLYPEVNLQDDCRSTA